MGAPTADRVIQWLENNWVGWSEPWWDDFIPFQEKHGYPRGVVVEWCGGLQCEGQWENGGDYGTPLPPKNAANAWYTPTGVNQFVAADRWTHNPRRGSWIFFDWQGGGLGWSGAGVDHVGIVTGPLLLDAAGNPVHDDEGQELVDLSHGYVDTIEGNVNEACGRFRRWFSSGTIRGFGLPVYAPAPSFDYGNGEPEPELKPVIPATFVPFMESENDEMLIIDLTNPDSELDGVPRTWGVTAGTLYPILGPEVDPTNVSRVSMSKAIFESLYARYVWRNRLALDLTPLK